MKKRIGSLLLALLLLASTVTLFSACGKKAELSEYTVVYAKDASSTFVNAAHALANLIKKATGSKATAVEDTGSEISEYEILIGNTSRKESEKALSAIKGHGHYTGMIGKKIVLCGTTNHFAMMALETFVADYFAGDALPTTLKVEKKVVSDIETITLTNAYNVVVSNTAFGTADWGESLDDGNTEKYDFAKYLAQKLIKDNITYVGQMSLVKDTDAAKATEILVGRLTERTETMSYLSTLDVNDYGISIKDGKVIVAAYSDTTLALAMKEFTDMVKDSRYKEDKKTRLVLPAAYDKTVTGDLSWVTDFPRPTGEGIVLSGAADVYDGSLEFLYTGTGVGAASYGSYCQSLVTAGYTLHSENEAEDSIFRTYVNEQKNTTLYVAYNAFKYAKADPVVTRHEPCIRIVSAALSSVTLLDEHLLNSEQEYVKKTDTRITNVELEGGNSNNVGNAYIVTLEDGSFAVLDGASGSTATISNRLWKILSDLHTKIWGTSPNANNKVRISMWYLSHGHGDHYAGFAQFCDDHKNEITVERVVSNFPSDYEVFNGRDINLGVRDSFFPKLQQLFPDIKYYKVHTGQSFWLCNSKFDVLYTHEDMYPWTIQYYNDSGVVLRQTIYDTVGAIGTKPTVNKTADPTTMLWLGDVQNRPSEWMRAMWGTSLASDMVQVSHHGSTGCEWAFYQYTQAEILWWPTYRTSYNAGIISSGKGDYRDVNAKLSKMASVDWIILGSSNNTTVTITAAGPDMTVSGSGTGLYNAGTGYYAAGATVKDLLDKR